VTTFPGSPKVLRGAIVGVDPLNPLASVIIFQYNPETLSRTVTAEAAAPGGDRGDALRLKGPPRESITASIEIDATDQLETGDAQAAAVGVHPVLASLEMLLYPKSALVIANEVLAAFGVIEVIPPEAPLTLFVWGPARVVPVRLTSLRITEEAFDTMLNPIRAKVDVTLDVLTYQDLGLLSVGGALSMAHQVAKEVLATMNGVGAVASVIASGGA
jgi:hypothetical protein